MASSRKDYISLGVSLVVIAIDDFNNKPISGNRLRVWIDGEKAAIQKQEGYYVFVNLKKKELVLHIEGEIYNKREILLDENKLKEYKQEALKVRMIPNRRYPITSDTTCIEGIAKPYSKIKIYSEEYTTPYKLLYTYEKGSREISIYHPNDINIEGKILLIKNKDDTQYEFVEIEGKKEGEQTLYHIQYPLSNTYKKIGTVLYPVYTVETDEKGEFYFPVSGLYTAKTSFVFILQGKEKKNKVVELTAGKVNKIYLRDL